MMIPRIKLLLVLPLSLVLLQSSIVSLSSITTKTTDTVDKQYSYSHHPPPRDNGDLQTNNHNDSNNSNKKNLKVFILMGQSNMSGFGQIAPESKPGTLLNLILQNHKYPHLLQSDGKGGHSWTIRDDVRVISRDGSNGDESSSGLGVGWNKKKFIGPEVQFGHVVGNKLEEPVLILKVGTGNRALGWDFLPPTSKRYKSKDTSLSYPGYGECPESSLFNSTKAKEKKRECGKQFDTDFESAKAVLDNLSKYYPGYQEEQGFEIAGFVFWQGFRDSLTKAHAMRYERNLETYITEVWRQYSSYPGKNKKFVLASIAFGGCQSREENERQGYGENDKIIYESQRSITRNRPKFQNRVRTIDARPFWRDYTVSPVKNRAHYNHNAETYMEVGNALGHAMIDLMLNTTDFVENHCASA